MPARFAVLTVAADHLLHADAASDVSGLRPRTIVDWSEEVYPGLALTDECRRTVTKLILPTMKP